MYRMFMMLLLLGMLFTAGCGPVPQESFPVATLESTPLLTASPTQPPATPAPPEKTPGSLVEIRTTALPTQEPGQMEAISFEEPVCFATVRAEYDGEGKGLYQAAYEALSQFSELKIEEVIHILSNLGPYLPTGETGGIYLEPELLSKRDFYYQEEKDLSVFQREWAELHLAALEIRSESMSYFLIFDQVEDGRYLPKWIAFEHWRATNTFEMEQIGPHRFVKIMYDRCWGTGILQTVYEWYDLEENRLALSYYSTTIEDSLPWSPMGWWAFTGQLDEPRIYKIQGTNQYLFELDTRIGFSRYPAEGTGEKVEWKKDFIARFLYDMDTGETYALDGGADHWYISMEGYGGDVSYFSPLFQDELEALAAQDNLDAALWARWVLAGAGSWKEFYEENGLTYVEPESDAG